MSAPGRGAYAPFAFPIAHRVSSATSFVWASRALNRRKRRVPARADEALTCVNCAVGKYGRPAGFFNVNATFIPDAPGEAGDPVAAGRHRHSALPLAAIVIDCLIFHAAVDCRKVPLAAVGCRWLPFLRDQHANLSAAAVVFCQNDSVARGQVDGLTAERDCLPCPGGGVSKGLNRIVALCRRSSALYQIR